MSNRQKEFYYWGCNLGKGQYAWDPTEAFLPRDFPQIAKICDTWEGSTGQIFVPETWLSSTPAVVDTVYYERQLESVKEDLDASELQRRKDNLLTERGVMKENSFYEKKKDYFKTTEDEVVVIHSAYILEPKAIGETNQSTVKVNGQVSAHIDISLPDNMTEGSGSGNATGVGMEALEW